MKNSACSLIMAIAALAAGCEMPKQCWYPKPQSSGIPNPTPGGYTAFWTDDPAADPNYGNPIHPLSEYGFGLTFSSSAGYVVHFSADNYRYDSMAVEQGTFEYLHGHGADGTVCPTDGYSISGRFVSESRAEGYFTSTSSCGCDHGGNFFATLDP